MDIVTLNEILEFVESDYRVTALIIESGQRKVFEASSISAVGKFVLKICPHHAIAVARIQREVSILAELQSKFFPKFFFQHFVTEETLRYFIDILDPKNQHERILEIEKMGIKPFFVTVEEFVDHITWDKVQPVLIDEKKLISFLIQIFEALDLLWQKKIVHRDLKPDNILVRPDFSPVIIDLGIAKNLNEGATALTHPLFPSPCTPRFAAPEQLTNDKTAVTYKTDQFSIGVISFLILTDKYPYGSDAEIGVEGVMKNFFSNNMEMLNKYNNKVSKEFVQFIEKLLKVQPFQRFRTVEEIILTLNKIKENL